MENVLLSKALVINILDQNKMQSTIERGYRYWLNSFITTKNSDNKSLEETSLIRKVIAEIEYPAGGFFETPQELEHHIYTLAGHIMVAYHKQGSK